MPRQTITGAGDGLTFTPVRGRALMHGYYLARRKTWASRYGWQVVFVYALEDEGRTKLAVFQIGSEDPEDPRQWSFRSRLTGLECLPAVLPPHPRIQLAEIVH